MYEDERDDLPMTAENRNLSGEWTLPEAASVAARALTNEPGWHGDALAVRDRLDELIDDILGREQQ